MKLELKYYKNKILELNPAGTVAVVCCWDSIDQTRLNLHKAGANMDNITCIGNLYGNGLRYLVRNLFMNPQITTVIFVGDDKVGFSQYLRKYLKGERSESMDKILDDDIRDVGNKLTCSATQRSIGYDEAASMINTFGDCRNACTSPRIDIPVVEYVMDTFPSNPNGHTIQAVTVKEAHSQVKWEINRFGVDTELAKGKRRILKNLVVEIMEPEADDGFELYQQDMLNPDPDRTKHYTYGYRLRGEYDALLAVKCNLEEDLEDRRCHISTWINWRDIMGAHRPCLLGVTFFKDKGKLYATATFRSQNAMDAWHMNAHGIIGYMEFVRGDLEMGTLTMISHNISIDPAGIVEIPQMFCKEVRDPNGIFTFAIKDRLIEATHWDHYGNKLKVYRRSKATAIAARIARDKAASIGSHFIYIGRQLERCEAAIRSNKEYVEA